MQLTKRLELFTALGNRLQRLSVEERDQLFAAAASRNSWFTREQCHNALEGIILLLDGQKLKNWIKDLPQNTQPKSVGVVMAGNIPMVGFHDLLSVLISGHKLVAKFSSQDTVLMQAIVKMLVEIDPEIEKFIQLSERMNGVDAVIATGSDNTSRYFEYYFRSIPHIIRKNRSSCGILTGEETSADFLALGKDVFSYFGLGCRNVSKIFVPKDYDFRPLLDSWTPFSPISDHHKYNNNYDYNKSILLVNRIHFYDNGFVLITENKSLVSPISVLYYEHYSDKEELREKINASSEKLQCIASKSGWFENSVPFGKTQQPELTDYADGVNTLEFLGGIK